MVVTFSFRVAARVSGAVALWASVLPVLPSAATGQGPATAVFGTVRTAESGLALPYSVVSIPALGIEQFSNDRGTFTMRELPAGALKLRFRHIGFVPRDTTVVLRAGDTLRVEISLTRLAIQLDAMHVTGGLRGNDFEAFAAAVCAVNETAAGRNAVAELFEQVKQNAEQFALLVRSHPYTKLVTRWTVERLVDGTIKDSRAVMTAQRGTADVAYRPGRVFRAAGSKLRGWADVIVLPQLPDFADPAFIANHCFAYGGDTTIDSVRFVRVAFAPVRTLKDPDIVGTVTLRADGYSIAEVDLRATGIPRELLKELSGVRAVTRFREILPGIAITQLVEGYLEPGAAALKAAPNVQSRGEVQMHEIKWLKGPP